MTKSILLNSLLLGLSFGALADQVPSGTTIDIRTGETIDARDAGRGRIFTGTVASDVPDRDGRVSIHRGARAELTVREVGSGEFAIDLESVTVDGRRYGVETEPIEGRRKDNVGANKRTGEYVGGGAVFGTIIGAIAGGGKGAAIGALAGGAAGAGTQMLTRGRAVHIPAESVVSFRLERPLELRPDRGYDRDGHHYHGER